MVMQLNVVHASLRKRIKSRNTKLEEEEEDQDDVCKSRSLSLSSKLGKKSNWKVVKVGRKATMKAKVWEGIRFQDINLKIPHHDNIHH